MKILHVITSLKTGGAEKLMVDLLPRLKNRGIEIDLLLFDGIETPFKHSVEKAGIKIYEIGKDDSVYSPFKLIKLFAFIKKKKYDIVHTHNTAPQLFAAIVSVFTQCHLITTEHGCSNRRRKWKWYRLIDRWMYNRYHKVICISKKAEENLRKHLGHCKADLLTINNGVDINKYAEATGSAELEQIAPKSRKIIMVAGFRWEKNQDTLIKALNFLPFNFHLFLVGDGNRRGELENFVKTENVSSRVHFLGIRTDIPELLHAADFIVMSSHFEGLSLSSVEGMCIGKPFIASDVDGLREVVDGYGILFPNNDHVAFANTIKNLDSDKTLYESVACNCLKRASSFDISTMEKEYYNIYISLKK